MFFCDSKNLFCYFVYLQNRWLFQCQLWITKNIINIPKMFNYSFTNYLLHVAYIIIVIRAWLVRLFVKMIIGSTQELYKIYSEYKTIISKFYWTIIYLIEPWNCITEMSIYITGCNQCLNFNSNPTLIDSI